jgi:hypothetical protein
MIRKFIGYFEKEYGRSQKLRVQIPDLHISESNNPILPLNQECTEYEDAPHGKLQAGTG